MQFNKFSIYSAVINNEQKNTDDFEKVLKIIDKLKSFDEMKDARAYLNESFGIHSDINKLPIANNALISVKTGSKYFNITIEHDNKVKSFNYNKGV